MTIGNFDMDNLARTYVQNTPKLAPYRKSISNVAGLLLAAVALLATVPTEWLPPSIGVPIALGAWFVTNVVTYFVPANAATQKQREAAAAMLARERAEAAATATAPSAGVERVEAPASVELGGAVGPDGAGY